MTAWDIFAIVAGFVLGTIGYRAGRAWRRRRAERRASENLGKAVEGLERAARNVRGMWPPK